MSMKLNVLKKILLTLSVLIMSMTTSLNAQNYDIFFWCSAEGSPMGMSGVDVTIDGVTVTSDFDGLALFEGYAAGDYDYVASKAGYANVEGTVTVVDQNIQEFVVMSLSSLSGIITYANSNFINIPLDSCTVELYNDAQELLFTTTTDTTGYYEFTGILDGDYTMETTCTLPRGGTTIFDAVRTRQFLGGTWSFSPLQEMAADVNNNANVDIFDAVLMQQSLSGGDLPALWTAPDYVFEVQSVTVSGGAGANSYQGMCSGDPDGSYIPQ